MKILILLLLLFQSYGQAYGKDKDTAPVLVELFSSQNCPACPPADEYMRTLSQADGVIALSCHVDYFGRTSANLGREFCTDRQDFYIKNMGRKKYFTPHMVVNGHMNEIGYETAKISKLMMQGQGDQVDHIRIQPKAAMSSGSVYDFYVKPRQLRRSANIWLAVYDKPKSIRERGRITTYHNVVKRIIPMGVWNGGAVSRAFFPIVDEASAGFAIVAQDNVSGKVLAIGEYKI